MKIFNGVDIIEISRIQKNIDRYGEKFLDRIYTKNEIEYCESKKANKYESYAARFAAKEAIYKAISSKLETECNWSDIEIINDPKGKPHVNLSIKLNGLEDMEVSLSHSKEMAMAVCVAVFKENKSDGIF